jgi:hypothetical protein
MPGPSVRAVALVHGSRDFRIRAVALVHGSRDFRIRAVALVLAGPTPNNDLPLIDPVEVLYPIAALRHGIFLGNRGVQ